MQRITNRKEAIEILSSSSETVPAGLKFEVDRFRPEDAWGVAQCCYSVYGSGYPVDTYYIPKKLIAEHENLNILGVVARTDGGEIVGYGALYRSSPPFPGIYEAGQYIVRKEYRNSRAAYQINEFVLKKYPVEAGIDALFGEAVCKHVIIQKMGQRSGSVETGIELDLMPEEAYESEDANAGRVAALLMFKVFKDRPHDIYLPEIFAGIVGTCIDKLGLSRSVKRLNGSAGGTDASVATQQVFKEAAVGRLSLIKTGADAARRLEEFESTTKNCKVRQVFLNIGDPGVGQVFGTLLAQGYFWGGYLPRWFDCDGLLLQKLMGNPNLEAIKLYSDWAKELLQFALKDRERAQGV